MINRQRPAIALGAFAAADVLEVVGVVNTHRGNPGVTGRRDTVGRKSPIDDAIVVSYDDLVDDGRVIKDLANAVVRHPMPPRVRVAKMVERDERETAGRNSKAETEINAASIEIR